MIPPSPDRFDDKNAIKWNLWKGRIAFNKRRSINDVFMIVVFFTSSEKKKQKYFYTLHTFLMFMGKGR